MGQTYHSWGILYVESRMVLSTEHITSSLAHHCNACLHCNTCDMGHTAANFAGSSSKCGHAICDAQMSVVGKVIKRHAWHLNMLQDEGGRISLRNKPVAALPASSTARTHWQPLGR